MPDDSWLGNEVEQTRSSSPQTRKPIYVVMSHLTDDFDPETIELLNVAIQDALREVQKGGSPLTGPAYARITRAVIAKRITEMAKSGERDRRKLSEHGLRSVIANQEVSRT